MERGNAKLKFFDRYLGPVLLLLLSPLRAFRLFRFKRKTNPLRKIALLKTAAIGDTVLASAIVNDLKAFDPTMQVVLFVGDSNFAFASRLSGVDRAVKLPLKNVLKSIALIRNERFDVFIDLDAWPRISAVLTALARANLRIGFQTPGQHRHFVYDKTVTHRNSQHELENYRSLLDALGVPTASPPQSFGHDWQPQGQTVVFHLWPSGTRSYLKEWPVERWRDLALRLRSIRDFSFILSGGAEDRFRAADFINGLPREIQPDFSNLAGSSFEKTLEVLQRARLLVSVNTGIMHVGAAMGVPTVGLHGPTNPTRWGPIGARVRTVKSQMPGAGALNLGFEYENETNFMMGIQVDAVDEACRDLLEQAARSLPVDPVGSLPVDPVGSKV